MPDFESLFRRAMASDAAPYPYQVALAGADALPEALAAPTGAGKTAAVVLSWIHRRRFAPDRVRRATPRRLVFCLPMRTLVTQTAAAIRTWLARLDLLDDGRGIDRGDGIAVHVLMGGDVDDDWKHHPAHDAVLVGTQDMLLSRALDRGYAASRFAWPFEFGLLSNDALWVFDEVQLMGVGLATGLQLAALRRQLGSFGPGHSLFMSATLDRAWLTTVDHPAPASVHALTDADLAHPALARRRRAPKRLARAATTVGKDFARPLAEEILAAHAPGSRTLVVLNRVDHATAVAEALGRSRRAPAVVLLHSRFRPPDRDAAVARALDQSFEGVIVSTQVIEAGVDLSARTLFTEIAPWPSLVQRAGRCNRAGELEDAVVHWIDHSSEKLAAPYPLAEIAAARATLSTLGSLSVEAIANAAVPLPPPDFAHVLRRRDVVDLFDTSAEIGGLDLDVSRFIRDGDDRDVQVFWRAFGDAPGDEPRPRREELCAVPHLALVDWVATAGRAAFRFDPLDGEWSKVRRSGVVPGAVYLLRAGDGGYSATRGFDPGSRAPVEPLPPRAVEAVPEEPLEGDPESELGRWVELAVHSVDAKRAASEIVAALDLPELPASTLVRAAHAHDLGKAHPVFQETMCRPPPDAIDRGRLWAKRDGRARHSVRGFRHELASALAWLDRPGEPDADLVAYLLAAHHGKVRLSIRALPDEQPDAAGRPRTRGIVDGDRLPAMDLGDGLVLAESTLSLAAARLGRDGERRSWTERAVALRDHFGPFRLAYLEALVRAADVLASRREQKGRP